MNNWFRPSIQQPRWIAHGVKALFAPVMFVAKVGEEYWKTWHSVFDPKGKQDDSKHS